MQTLKCTIIYKSVNDLYYHWGRIKFWFLVPVSYIVYYYYVFFKINTNP